MINETEKKRRETDVVRVFGGNTDQMVRVAEIVARLNAIVTCPWCPCPTGKGVTSRERDIVRAVMNRLVKKGIVATVFGKHVGPGPEVFYRLAAKAVDTDGVPVHKLTKASTTATVVDRHTGEINQFDSTPAEFCRMEPPSLRPGLNNYGEYYDRMERIKDTPNEWFRIAVLTEETAFNRLCQSLRQKFGHRNYEISGRSGRAGGENRERSIFARYVGVNK